MFHPNPVPQTDMDLWRDLGVPGGLRIGSREQPHSLIATSRDSGQSVFSPYVLLYTLEAP